MTTELRAALRAEAVKFADQFYETALKTLLSTPLSDLIRESGESGVTTTEPLAKRPTRAIAKAPAKKKRAGAADIGAALEAVLELLGKTPEGLRFEGLRENLGLEGGVLKKAIELGRSDELIVKTGDRRATTYFLPGGDKSSSEGVRVIRRKKS